MSTIDPLQRFIASMEMNFEKWHDGAGYDLDLLRALSPEQREAAEEILISHRPRDWRDIEALAQIDSGRARAAVKAALNDSDPQVRREAMKYAADEIDPMERQRQLLRAIGSSRAYAGLSEMLDEVEEFHPPEVIDALFRATLQREGEVAVHLAAMLLFLHGKSSEPFDWEHRPFFLKFNTEDGGERQAAFKELCQRIGIDPAKYLSPVS
jgi:hypothetical protein